MFAFAELIEQAGFPKGVVSVITGDAENCAIPLTSHPDVDKIAFTGGMKQRVTWSETLPIVLRSQA